MAEKSFTIEASINTTPEHIIEHMMEPDNYIGLQPFMRSSNVLERGTNASGQAYVHYQAVERVPLFGSFGMNTPLDVTTTTLKPGAQVESLVNSSGTIVRFVYSFTGSQPARIALTVTAVQTPPLMGGFVISRAREAQTTLLANLKKRLESSA